MEFKDKSIDNVVNLHEGHRIRLRNELDQKNLVEVSDYKVLEYILTLVIKRRDTNELAHTLINTFGNLANVLDADQEALMTVKGITPTIAYFLHFIPLIFRNYKISKQVPKNYLKTANDVFNYLGNAISHLSKEEFYMICLDNSNRVINHKMIAGGNQTSVNIDIKASVQFALASNASKVILLHNHPTGDPHPSQQDLITTKKMLVGFESSGIQLYEHIIVNYRDEYFSFANNGFIEQFRKEYKKMFE